jgi:DNA-binding MarR family transcriptional regulator
LHITIFKIQKLVVDFFIFVCHNKQKRGIEGLVRMEFEYRSVPLVKRVCDTLEREINNAVRSQGVTYSQIQLLLRLHEAEAGTLPLKELEARLGVSQAAVARLVKHLAQKGYVTVLNDARDGRVKHAGITPLGTAKCDDAHGHMDAIERKLGLTGIEARLFHELLQKVSENLR